MNNLNTEQYGFTLIELLISLVLGALISAAVIQIFITSQRVDGIQRSGSEIQSSAIYGLQSMERQIRMANLGNEGKRINDTTDKGGIITTSDDGKHPDSQSGKNPFNIIAVMNGKKLSEEYLTSGDGVKNWKGPSNIKGVFSDQITFQYTNNVDFVDPDDPSSVPPADSTDFFDCEGATVDTGDRVIQRYYVEADSKNKEVLNLACDAGRVVTPKSAAGAPNPVDKITGLGSNSVVVIADIDQFSVRLGAATEYTDKKTGKLELNKFDVSVKEYVDPTKAVSIKPYITNVKLAILAKSSSLSPEKGSNSFDIFGKNQVLKKDNDTKHLRRVFETNILLRNARVFVTDQ